MSNERHDSRRISKSTKLRKYASVYNSYVRKTEQSKISKSPRRARKPKESRENPPKKKEVRKTLNAYQKFVQQESKKDKYRDMPGKQRLGAIAALWKKVR
jgi:hypothetical protein